MQFLVKIDKLSDQVEKFLAYVSFGLFSFGFCFALEQVISRNVAHVTLNWAEEVITLAMLFSLFLASSLATKHNSHIKIDVLVNRLLPDSNVGTIFKWLIPCVEFVTAIFLLSVYVQYEVKLFESGSVLTSGFGFPLWIAHASLGIGLAGVVFFSFVKICHLVSGGE